jgi:hypothetical protein
MTGLDLDDIERVDGVPANRLLKVDRGPDAEPDAGARPFRRPGCPASPRGSSAHPGGEVVLEALETGFLAEVRDHLEGWDDDARQIA